MTELDNYPRLRLSKAHRWTGFVPAIGQKTLLQPVVHYTEEGFVLCFSEGENFCPSCPLLSDCPRPYGTEQRLHDRPIPAEKIKLSIV